MRPLVSIIIATYNRKDLLKIALESALKQNYENLEIIVTDNASIDGTDIFMQSYLKKYDNLIYIRREENIGPFYNGYKAYSEVSKGKYIFFLCDDDYMMSDTFIKNSVAIMEQYPNVVLVTGHVQMYFEEWKKYVSIPYHKEQLVTGIDYFMRQSTVMFQSYYPEIISQFYILRREVLDKNPFYRSFKESGDVATRFFFPTLGDVYFLNEYVGCYVLHNSIRESSNVETLNSDCDSALKLIDGLVDLYSRLYPQYSNFFKRFIPLKIADAFIRDRIFKTFHLYDIDKAKKKKLKKFLKTSNLKNNKIIYDFLNKVFFNKFENLDFSLLRFNFKNYNFDLFRVILNYHYLIIIFFNIKLTIKIKLVDKIFFDIPKLYAYASCDIKQGDDLYAYYNIDKVSDNQIDICDNILEFIATTDIKKGEPITKLNSKNKHKDKK